MKYLFGVLVLSMILAGIWLASSGSERKQRQESARIEQERWNNQQIQLRQQERERKAVVDAQVQSFVETSDKTQNDWDTRFDYVEKCLELSRSRHDYRVVLEALSECAQTAPNDRRRGLAIQSMSSCYLALNDFDSAESCVDTVMNIWEELYGLNSIEVSRMQRYREFVRDQRWR